MKKQWDEFKKDESGEFGVKQIAITVAVIVLIGFIVSTLKDYLPAWIQEIWTTLVNMIQDVVS